MIEHLSALLERHRLVADQERAADLPQGGVANRRGHEVALVYQPLHGTARPHIGERRLQMVDAEDALRTQRTQELDPDVLVGLQERQQVDLGLLDKVDLAAVQGLNRRLGVRQHHPFDAVDLDDLAAGKAVCRLGPRHVLGVLGEHHLAARDPLVLDKLERPRTDDVGNRLVWVRGGQPLRHDHWHVRVRLGQRIEHQTVRLIQHQAERLVVDRRQLLGEFLDDLAAAVLHPPALQRGDDVLSGDRRSVMELQAVAQHEGVGEAIGADLVVADHLRLRRQVLVEREQRVEDHQREIGSDVGRVDDRIKDLDVGVHHRGDGLLVGCRGRGRPEPHKGHR